MRRTILASAVSLLACLIQTAPASAASIHETFVVEGAPSARTIQSWSRLPGTRNFLIRLNTPSKGELETLAGLERADLLQIESDSYPEKATVASWQKIASKGAQFVGLDLQLPSAEQVETLNAIGFSRIIFLISYVPDPDEGQRLGTLSSPVSVTFAMSAYPRYDDKALLLAIPAKIPFTFAAGYWPGYTHMDLFNMLPNKQRLRITGEFPSDDQLQYTTHLKQLEELTVETTYGPPSPDVWTKLPQVKTTWIAKEWLPSSEDLSAFDSAPGSRRFVFDKDGPLEDTERAALGSLKNPVEWVHSVNAQ